jgi:hypothetical protein
VFDASDSLIVAKTSAKSTLRFAFDGFLKTAIASRL